VKEEKGKEAAEEENDQCPACMRMYGMQRTLLLAEVKARRVGKEDGRHKDAEGTERHRKPELLACGGREKVSTAYR
jgi:hypothetical protein